jgi:hypothetical protein
MVRGYERSITVDGIPADDDSRCLTTSDGSKRGKHVPASQRSVHINEKLRHMNYTTVLPVVVVRDPYTWMQSM